MRGTSVATDHWIRDLAHYLLTGQHLGEVVREEKNLLDAIIERLGGDDDAGRVDREVEEDTHRRG